MSRLLHSNRRSGGSSGGTVPGITADGQGGDGSSFGAQDVMTEGYRCPAGVASQRALAVGPAALGTGEDGDRVFGAAVRIGRQCARERRGSGLFLEEVTIAGGIRQCRGE